MQYTTNQTEEFMVKEGKDVAQLFSPFFEETTCIHQENTYVTQNKKYISKIQIFHKNKQKTYTFLHFLPKNCSFLQEKSFIKAYHKAHLYLALKKFFHASFAWGALTGIHPTMVVRKLIQQGFSKQKIVHQLHSVYGVSHKKIEMLFQIIKTQGALQVPANHVHLYIHIPFCPSKCMYCSFLAEELCTQKHALQKYILYIKQDILNALWVIKQQNLTLQSIYIGGGTPTTLSAKQLEDVLSILPNNIPEFTVEAGRPDTITKEKLEVLKNYGVTRICINPQTMHNQTLQTIGRWHTAEQIKEAVQLAQPFGFEINTDLIAGLPNETEAMFASTLQQVLALKPHQITVHTLSVKKGSPLEKLQPTPTHTKRMVTRAYAYLTKHHYKPYYIYKQKNMFDHQENIGYTKTKPCLFNVHTMEECASVIACGAGAISKKVALETGKIERLAQPKDITLYQNRFEELMQKRAEFFNKKL